MSSSKDIATFDSDGYILMGDPDTINEIKQIDAAWKAGHIPAIVAQRTVATAVQRGLEAGKIQYLKKENLN